MYFKSKVDKGVEVNGQKITAKEIQTICRLTFGKIAERQVLPPVALVHVCGTEGSHQFGFRYSPPRSVRPLTGAMITLQFKSVIRFPQLYIGEKVTSIQELLTVCIAHAAMYHHQHFLGKKMKRKRVYNRTEAARIARLCLQHYRVYAADFNPLESKLVEEN